MFWSVYPGFFLDFYCKCYDIFTTLTVRLQVGHYSNVQAIAKTLSAGSLVILQQLVDYAKRPGLQYFLDKFSNELSTTVAAFKAASLFLTHKVLELKQDAAAIYSLLANGDEQLQFDITQYIIIN